MYSAGPRGHSGGTTGDGVTRCSGLVARSGPIRVEAMRIALFSEVYWPMVSGVGVTLLRLTEALQARGHEVRVYSATYALPPGTPDRPKCIARLAFRSSSTPTFSGPFRGSGTSWTTSSFPAGHRPRRHRVLARHRGRQGGPTAGHPAHRLGPYGLRPVRRALRSHVGAAGRVALPPLVLRPGAPGALPVEDLRGLGASPRGTAHGRLEPRRRSGGVLTPAPERGLSRGTRTRPG